MPWTVHCVNRRRMEVKLMEFFLDLSVQGTDNLWSFWVLSITEKILLDCVGFDLCSPPHKNTWLTSRYFPSPTKGLITGRNGRSLDLSYLEGRTLREDKFALHGWELLTQAYASFILNITKNLDIILIFEKPFRSGLSPPPFVLFVLPVYSFWQKIICHFLFSRGYADTLGEKSKFFWVRGFVFMPLYPLNVLPSERTHLAGLSLVGLANNSTIEYCRKSRYLMSSYNGT